MCRFLLYLGEPVLVSSLITDPDNSLIHQSVDSQEREEPLNGDGFGLAWYVPTLSRHPALFRSISPAWSNQNLRHLARMTTSHCVLAHVRAASDGLGVAEANCHPFSWGPFAFMHNGGLAHFVRAKRRLLGLLSDASFDLIEGSTDSEFIFAYFLDRWRQTPAQQPAGQRLAAAVARTIADLSAAAAAVADGEALQREESYLNLAVSDGEAAVASRFASGPPQFCESLHLRVEPTSGGRRPTALVSSEALSGDGSWQTVPPNHLVVLPGDGAAHLRPLPAGLDSGGAKLF